MKYTLTPLKYLFTIGWLVANSYSHAFDANALEKQADSSITALYHTLNSMPNISMANRIAWLSKQFIGKKYILGALGEGPQARYDQFPRYRVDGFDCDTYVNTVLALALANSPAVFQQCLRLNRYKNGHISYIDRNHFTSIDWNINNQQRGVLKDITLEIKNKRNETVAKWAVALINKPGWYAHKTKTTIRLQKFDRQREEQLLAELKNKGRTLKATTSKIPYIPLTALFAKNGEPNMYLFSQIPDGAIIEIVRPNWDLQKLIGTSLNISHLGFAIWVNHQLFFREASSQLYKVVDVFLIDYLKDAQHSQTIKGINIQVVLPARPVGDHCDIFLNANTISK